MMNYAIMDNREDAVAVNDILYPALVTEDGINFKNGFMPSTTCYIDPDDYKHPDDERRLLFLDQRILGLYGQYPTIDALIDNPYTIEEVYALGWFGGDS